MSKTKKQARYGLFYVSNGRWNTTPYAGFTFTEYMMNHKPLNKEISTLKNRVLKSRIRIKRVS